MPDTQPYLICMCVCCPFLPLSDEGVMVNYGGMAKQPVTVPVVSSYPIIIYTTFII